MQQILKIFLGFINNLDNTYQIKENKVALDQKIN